MYMLWGGGAPFTIVGDGSKELKDRSGNIVTLLGISGKILQDLKSLPEYNKTLCAIVSCTDEPR